MNVESENFEADEELERQVEAAARDLVRTINGSDIHARAELRQLAIEILREQVEIAEPRSSEPGAGTSENKFNAFGIGIPLGLMGLVLVFLFPLVGIAMFAAAAIMVAWGLASTLLTRG